MTDQPSEAAGTTPREGEPGPVVTIQFSSPDQFEHFRGLIWKKQLAELINPAYLPDVVLTAVVKSGESSKAIKIKELP